MKQTIIFICLINFQFVFGQQQTVDPTTFDYSKADSIALNLPKKKYKSVWELVSPLTRDLQSDHEKFRVLFRWITDNIAYNHRYKSNNADKVLKSKKAVCGGYSTLLSEMCNSAGIDCEIIVGYSKTSINDINKNFQKPNHAWNAVKLYDKWYLLDVTWATSYYDLKKKKIIKSFNELYYLTPPEIFVKNHFPKKKEWQLLDKPVGKPEFRKSHIYYTGFFDNHLTDLQPEKGIIKIRLKDTLEIKFKSDYEIKNAIIELGNEQFIYKPKIEQKDSAYFIKQKFEKSGLYELTLFLNRKSVAAYRLEVRE